MKKITAFLFALTAAFCFVVVVSAGVWDTEDILEYAEYRKTHSYEEQIEKYYDTFQADKGASDKVFSEEEFRRIQNGENALIVIDYELSEEVYGWVGEPEYTLIFPFLMSDGREINSSDRPEATCSHRLIDRNVFTVREHLLEGGIENETDQIIFAGINGIDPYICGYVFKSYTFIPCENGWNEIDGARYYVKKDGTLATSSLTIDGIRYKFGKDGVCQGKYTGKIRSGNNVICYKDGVKQEDELFTGWIKFGKKRFYAKDGVIQTGWVNISPEWYYIDPKEGRLTGTHEIDGASCTFDKNGKWDQETRKSADSVYYYVEYKMDKSLYGGVYWRDGMVMVWSVDGKAEKKLQKRYPNNGGIYYMEAKYSMAEMNAIIDDLWTNHKGDITSSMVDVFNNRLKLGFTDEQLKRIQPYLDSLENKDCIDIVDETGVIFYDD